jgi:MFS family permease
MGPIVELLRCEPKARIFFGALTQSALGTGAAYVALLLVALERFDSPWAIGLVLLADVVPAMFFGPLFGALADRWSRKRCVIAADVLRAVAFAGIVFVDGFVPTLMFALLAGVGTGLFTPASLAALPSLVHVRRLPAATSLYSAIADLGFTAGPALSALLLLVGGAQTVLEINAATFATSAFALAALRFGAAPGCESSSVERPNLLRETLNGLVATAGIPRLRLLLLASGAALLFGALFNVGQPLLAQDELGIHDAGFAALVASYGVGFIGGSLSGSANATPRQLLRRYLAGTLLMGLGFLASGVAPAVVPALVAFLGAGYGNGLLLVYERRLVQLLAPDAIAGRVFGIRDAITAWAFALGFIAGPLLIAGLGTRPVMIGAGISCLLVWLAATWGLRRVATTLAESALARGTGAELAWRGGSGEHRADPIGS